MDSIPPDGKAVDREPARKIAEGPSQMFHDRARSSQIEYRKLLLSLGAGTLALYFAVLTGKELGALGQWEIALARASLALMGVSVLAGLLLWKVDAQRNYILAAGLQTKSKETKRRRSSSYRRLDTMFTLLSRVQTGTFFFAIIISVAYSILRLEVFRG